MNLELGEEITVNNNEKYIVMGRSYYNEKNYVFLMNNDQDLIIKVAEEVIDKDKVFVKMINDKKIIKALLEEMADEKISE